MDETLLEELKLEADQLGIPYSKTIKFNTLKERVDTAYKKLEAGDNEVVQAKLGAEHKKTDLELQLEKLATLKKKGKVTQIIKLSLIDKRLSSDATTGYLSDGLLSMRVPLEVWSEVPNYLIRIAEKAKYTIHKTVGEETIAEDTQKYVVAYKNK